MMPPFVVFPTNRIAHFVEVSLYLFYLAQQVILGMEYDEALEFINKNDTLGTYERMKKSGYLRKRLIV